MCVSLARKAFEMGRKPLAPQKALKMKRSWIKKMERVIDNSQILRNILKNLTLRRDYHEAVICTRKALATRFLLPFFGITTILHYLYKGDGFPPENILLIITSSLLFSVFSLYLTNHLHSSTKAHLNNLQYSYGAELRRIHDDLKLFCPDFLNIGIDEENLSVTSVSEELISAAVKKLQAEKSVIAARKKGSDTVSLKKLEDLLGSQEEKLEKLIKVINHLELKSSFTDRSTANGTNMKKLFRRADDLLQKIP